MKFFIVIICFLAGRADAGFEIADLTGVGTNFQGYTKVYIDFGTNPIPETAWDAYVPPVGYLKNTPRNAEFNEENTLSSPGYPAPEVQIEIISDYTWKFIAQTQSAMWPYDASTNPYQEAATITTPSDNFIKFSSNEKNQEMIFWANATNDPGGDPILRYYITDEWGNQYILGASGATNDEDIITSFNAAVLPTGWTKSTGYLAETTSLLPAYGAGDQAHYNLFRESGDNTFFQFYWSGSGTGIANQIVDMPIWGGASNDIVRGRAGDDNVIHGAEGNDTIYVLGHNDTIWGDDGTDEAILSGNLADYILVGYTNDLTWFSLSDLTYIKTFYDVETVTFGDGTHSTSNLITLMRPALSMLIQAIGMEISWSITNSPGYFLQQSTNLASSDWTTIGVATNLIDDRYVVTQEFQEASAYYRLTR